MRVGIVTGEYPPMQGGIGAYTHILAHEMKHQGAAISIFTDRKASSVDPDILIMNWMKSWGIDSLTLINQWARDFQADVINVQFQTAAYEMSPWIHFLPRFSKMPVVTTFHDLRHPYLFPKAGGLRGRIIIELAQKSAGVIVTNHEDYARLTQIEHKKLIPIGSNIRQPLPDDFEVEKWRTEVGANPNDFVIAYFGLFNQSKGLDILIDSLADLRKERVPVRLLLVGGGLGSGDPTNEAYFESLKAQIQRLGLVAFIHTTGYLDNESDVGAYLAASDVVALPFTDGASYRRGSLMAAIQYGCAIISTIPTVEIPTFRNGENMLLIPRGDKNALTAALNEVRQSPDLRLRLQLGASELSKQFDWSKITQETLDFFEQVRAR
ncbi:MAG: glycosyltransferase [Anaerolineaceae bacterium]|nr:glycosyltransferase [Anaerolineaceae bacterium]